MVQPRGRRRHPRDVPTHEGIPRIRRREEREPRGAARHHPRPDRAQRRGEDDLLQSPDEISHAVALPYGRKRALEIATTLALDPEMMLLDEPTAGMGHEDVDRIAALIKKVAASRTVLMVEHNLSVVENLCSTITVLARGEVLAEGDYASVSRNPDVIQAYMGSGHA